MPYTHLYISITKYLLRSADKDRKLPCSSSSSSIVIIIIISIIIISIIIIIIIQ